MLHARRSFFQAAWVVNDLYTAMNRWIDNASVGPFLLFPGTRFHKALWYGRPVDVTVDIALAQVGSMQIELIKQRGAGALVYPKTVLAGTAALHHPAAFTDDLHSECARASGYPSPSRWSVACR
jgi:hypothetical protein